MKRLLILGLTIVLLICSRGLYARVAGVERGLKPATTGTVQQSQIDIGINKGILGVKIAVPEFQPAATDEKTAALTTLFNQVLWNDLDYSGVLTLVSRSFYPIGKFLPWMPSSFPSEAFASMAAVFRLKRDCGI